MPNAKPVPGVPFEPKIIRMTIPKRLFLPVCVLFLLLQISLKAQIIDDFSDGDLTANPAWEGDLIEFIVTSAGELQLNAPDLGSSAIAVRGNIPDSAVWQIDIRMEFAPSNQNLLRIYLLADQADLLQANGYFLEIGETGSADALRFYRQDSTTATLLSTGMSGFVATDPVHIRLKVKRSVAGDWTVAAAPSGGAYTPQGGAFDAVYPAGPGRYFGLYCLYSATRKDKFVFDNLTILPDIPDTQPPVLISAQASSATTVSVVFDEALDAVSALDPAHYAIAGVGQPASVNFASGTRQAAVLQLSTSLNTGAYTLQTNQIADTLGNVSGLQTTGFSYLKIDAASEFDILINEIMADPTPSQGLPEEEWIELYNRSNKIIDLSTLRLSDGGTAQLLPAGLLYPDSFVVLATPASTAALAGAAGRVLAMSGFPSLNNDGDPLYLGDAAGNVIDRVTYSIDWHTEPGKRDGGWSLERVNPQLPCLGGANWVSCPVKPGGTPGRTNAGLKITTDADGPKLLSAIPESTGILQVTFSEGLDRLTAENPSAYHLAPARNVASAVLSPDRWDIVLIQLAEPLEPGVVYAFWASAEVEDCSGNPVSALDTVYVGLPEVPEPQDIVINEILFNPETGGSDYVELYNRSQKIFNWYNFYLENTSGSSGSVAIARQQLFLPGDYAVFTPSPTDILNRFSGTRSQALFSLPLPSLPDDAGNVSLSYSDGAVTVTVDSFDYVDDYHNALLAASDRNGVALERIRAGGRTNDPSNWTSAARSGSGSAGTPTQPNSQQLPADSTTIDDLIRLEPARLSPDDDGYEDFLEIRYQLPESGYAATMTIYDSEGIPVKHLVRQQLISTEGALRWDGDMDNGTRARPGIYILFLEIYSPSGAVRQVKKPFALVKRF